MRSAILIVALVFRVDFGIDAAATATHQERYYADALDELEHKIGSGVHGTSEMDENAKTYKIHNKRRGVEEVAEATAHEHQNAEELARFKKKVDSRKAERERRARDDIDKLNEQLKNMEETSTDDIRQKFHRRQKEKKIQLDEMHREVTEVLDAHHEGRKLLSDRDLEQHTRKRASLEKKRRSLEQETPEKYIERMERHEEKLLEKLERKKKRHDERFKRREEEL